MTALTNWALPIARLPCGARVISFKRHACNVTVRFHRRPIDLTGKRHPFCDAIYNADGTHWSGTLPPLSNSTALLMKDYLRVAADLSEDERAVISRMTNGEWVYPMATIAADVCQPVRQVREIIRGFAADGLAELAPLMSEDGEVRGRGYYLTRDGLGVQSAILGGEA